jgi:enterobactin synthetase component D
VHSRATSIHLSLTPAAATAGARAGRPALDIAALPVSRCANPTVLPPFVRQCSATFDPLEVGEVAGIAPQGAHYESVDRLEEATPARRFEFLAGRACVNEALQGLGVHVAGAVRRRLDGTPAWPTGVTGSITHTHGFVTAAVALTARAGAIGIDSETILSAERARRVAGVFATPAEIAAAQSAGFDRETAVTLIFSAKESLFKALHASVRRVFDFHDVQITRVDGARRHFTATVQQALAVAFPAGSTLAGRFDADAVRVHTAMVVAPRVRE